MDRWRLLKQLGLLVVIGCFIGSIAIIALRFTGSLNASWPVVLTLAIVLLGIGVIILRLIGSSSYLPTAEQVQQVVADIRRAHDMNIESHKAELYFCFPPHWRTYKQGKEGWILRPKGLGVPVAISIWVTDQVPKFSGHSLEVMTKNVRDLAKREGATIKDTAIKPRQIAGMDGIEYTLLAPDGHEMLGYFWSYKGGDFQVMVDASSPEHLRVIRPAVDAFLGYCHMP